MSALLCAHCYLLPPLLLCCATMLLLLLLLLLCLLCRCNNAMSATNHTIIHSLLHTRAVRFAAVRSKLETQKNHQLCAHENRESRLEPARMCTILTITNHLSPTQRQRRRRRHTLQTHTHSRQEEAAALASASQCRVKRNAHAAHEHINRSARL